VLPRKRSCARLKSNRPHQPTQRVSFRIDQLPAPAFLPTKGSRGVRRYEKTEVECAHAGERDIAVDAPLLYATTSASLANAHPAGEPVKQKSSQMRGREAPWRSSPSGTP
jgi:hypothetical protein